MTPKTKKRQGALVNVASVNSSGQQENRNQGGNDSKMPDPCPTCGMFYLSPSTGGCKMVSKGKFIARNVAGMKGAILKPQGGGKWVLNNNFIGRFRRHGLGHLKISSQQEQSKVIDELNQEIKTMYEQSQVNNGNAATVNAAVATSNAYKTTEPQPQKKKHKKKLQKQVVEEDYSDEEDTEGLEGGDSDESHFD